MHGSSDAPLGQREDAARKRALARAAPGLVAGGRTAVLDTGCATLHLAGLLPRGRGLRVVTNPSPGSALRAAGAEVRMAEAPSP